jgi:hypothetical protein
MRNGFNQGKGLDTSDSETLDGSEVTLGYSEPTSRAHNAGDTRPGADHHQCSMQHFYYLQAISAYHTIGLVSIPAASISTHHYRDTLSSGSLLCGMPPRILCRGSGWKHGAAVWSLLSLGHMRRSTSLAFGAYRVRGSTLAVALLIASATSFV